MKYAGKDITVAAIDLGSNSFRLLIARIRGGEMVHLSSKLVTVRLGQGLRSSGLLHPEAIERGVAALEEFRDEMARYSLDHCRCCGTEALRKAVNAEPFLVKAAAIVGRKIEILTGDQEASLSCTGALRALAGEPPFPLMVVDVGGSSTEITYLADPGSSPLTASIPAGAVAFTELANEGGSTAARDHLADQLTPFANRAGIRPSQVTIVATGGTATSLASLALGLTSYDGNKVHGHRLACKDLNRLAEELGSRTANELESLPGMEPGRGNILSGGLEIYQEIIATIGVDVMIVSDAGLLEGIAFSCNDRTSPHPGDPA